MADKIKSEAKQKRIDRFKLIKSDFQEMKGDKTAIVRILCIKHGASTATIYKALRFKDK